MFTNPCVCYRCVFCLYVSMVLLLCVFFVLLGVFFARVLASCAFFCFCVRVRVLLRVFELCGGLFCDVWRDHKRATNLISWFWEDEWAKISISILNKSILWFKIWQFAIRYVKEKLARVVQCNHQERKPLKYKTPDCYFLVSRHFMPSWTKWCTNTPKRCHRKIK